MLWWWVSAQKLSIEYSQHPYHGRPHFWRCRRGYHRGGKPWCGRCGWVGRWCRTIHWDGSGGSWSWRSDWAWCSSFGLQSSQSYWPGRLSLYVQPHTRAGRPSQAMGWKCDLGLCKFEPSQSQGLAVLHDWNGSQSEATRTDCPLWIMLWRAQWWAHSHLLGATYRAGVCEQVWKRCSFPNWWLGGRAQLFSKRAWQTHWLLLQVWTPVHLLGRSWCWSLEPFGARDHQRFVRALRCPVLAQSLWTGIQRIYRSHGSLESHQCWASSLPSKLD